MKQILLYYIFSLNFIYSQEAAKIAVVQKNEIRFNIAKFALNNIIELSYERFLNDKFSVGLSSVFLESKYDKENYKISALTEYVNEYQLNPFIRYAYKTNKRDNLYFEAFSSINSGRFKSLERIENEDFAYYIIKQNEYFKFGLGASIGSKFYVFKRFVIDTNAGYAANITRKKDAIPAGVFRVGVNIGYKF